MNTLNHFHLSKRVFVTVLLMMSSLGGVSTLEAQDFFNAGVSARSTARAGIYIPSGENALDALSLNPAGLSFLGGSVVNLSALGVLARGDFQNAANSHSAMRLNAGAIPFGAAGVTLGKRWTVGAGFMPDLLSSSKWQFRDTPGTAGADYGAQRETSKILAFRSSAGVAYRFNSRFSAGITMSAIYNSNTLTMPYVFQSHPELKGLKTLLDLNTTGLGWNTTVGVVVSPSRHWQIGAAFRTKSSITSTGTATGNMGVQFAALQIPFRPDFSYRAQVRVELPQSALLNVVWDKSPVLRFSAQSNWTNWSRSFASLPVALTNGSNSDINGFLKTSGIQDAIPLLWRDQFSFRVAAERRLGESFSLAGGFVHENNPVPSSTLSPLTAAIMESGLTAGGGYTRGRLRVDLAYQFHFSASQSVGTSGLLSGEFDHSRVRVGTQGLTLSTSIRL